MSAAIGLAISFLVTVLAMPVVIQVLKKRAILDTPNSRSSHEVPTPRGGGLGVAVGISFAMVAAVALGDAVPAEVLLAGFVLGIVGFWDDVCSLSPMPRLASQLVVGGLVGFLIGGHAAAMIGAVVLPLGVNAVNFMDGINGISGISMAVWGLALYWACREVSPSLAWLGAVVTGSAASFLLFNFPNAKVFLGDSGSYLFGSVMAAGSLAAIVAGADMLLILTPTVVYLVDVGFTLTKRVIGRRPVMQAHREHVYQVLAMRFGHVPVALSIGSISLLLVIFASTLQTRTVVVALVVASMAYLATPALSVVIQNRKSASCG